MTARKPRKMPKNQRTYKTPSGKKVHLVQVSGTLREQLAHASVADPVGTPILYHCVNDNNTLWVEAGQLRKWLGSRVTSGEKL